MSNPEIRKERQAAALIPRGLPDRINDMLTSSHRKFSYSFVIILSTPPIDGVGGGGG